MSAEDELVPNVWSPAEAVSLSRALLQQFDTLRWPESALKKAARALRERSETLRVAWEASVRISIASDHGSSAQRADLEEDAVWSALYHWLKGWSSLPAKRVPDAEKAQQVFTAMFADGVAFLELPYALEWAEAERRLSWLYAHGNDALIDRLGGAVLLRTLRAVHKEYEKVLGIAPEGGPLQETFAPMLEDCAVALREYVAVLKVHSDRERTEKLLEPLHEWNSIRVGRKSRVE